MDDVVRIFPPSADFNQAADGLGTAGEVGLLAAPVVKFLKCGYRHTHVHGLADFLGLNCLDRFRRFSSRSTASRMKVAIPLSPTSVRMRSRLFSERRTSVGLFPSGGLPIQ